jgi:hypothetical protein
LKTITKYHYIVLSASVALSLGNALPANAQRQWSNVDFPLASLPKARQWIIVPLQQPLEEATQIKAAQQESTPARSVETPAPASNSQASELEIPTPSPGVPATTPIQGLTRRPVTWPAPSLNPGVPSAFIAKWGDVFLSASVGTSGNLRPDVDGAWVGGFGLGDPQSLVAIELSGGCGSIKRFCGNGGAGFSVSRDLVSKPDQRVAFAIAWRNALQWGYEGTQDNVFSAGFSYAIPLRNDGTRFRQTLQIDIGAGNSTFAPYTANDSEERIGAFGSIGVELSPSLGVSTGWSGRGINAQISYTPFRYVPISVNLLGADLFNQSPAGTVGILTISWGSNFRTANFDTSILPR